MRALVIATSAGARHVIELHARLDVAALDRYVVALERAVGRCRFALLAADAQTARVRVEPLTDADEVLFVVGHLLRDCAALAA